MVADACVESARRRQAVEVLTHEQPSLYRPQAPDTGLPQ